MQNPFAQRLKLKKKYFLLYFDIFVYFSSFYDCIKKIYVKSDSKKIEGFPHQYKTFLLCNMYL